jgi:hypothetical protein
MNATTARQVLRVVPSWLAGLAISTPIVAILQGVLLLQGQYFTIHQIFYLQAVAPFLSFLFCSVLSWWLTHAIETGLDYSIQAPD